MIRTLRESKAKLSELVERASRGEDVLITVHGKVKARLTRGESERGKLGESWANELRALQRSQRSGRSDSTGQILTRTREDRI